MKRLSVAFLLFFMTINCLAQVQQGIVKTRGRMVDGQLVPGIRLQGATITLNIGNPLVSGDNGTFSFVVPSDRKYSLVSVRKSGYTLADIEYTSRSFAYSQDPFYVVLEDEKQRQADINAAIRRIRRTLENKLKEREDEIEQLKERSEIAEDEYQKKLSALYATQSNLLPLITMMAERYASTDYDQLNEYNRQVQLYIEEGELQKADSLIRSKGDIEQRVADYHKIVAANEIERKRLEQSEKGAAKAYEDISQDLYRLYELSLLQGHLNIDYLKKRADLKPIDLHALSDLANICYSVGKFILTMDASGLNTEFSNTYFDTWYDVETGIPDYEAARRYLNEALETYNRIYELDSTINHIEDIAKTEYLLGDTYFAIVDYEHSEKSYLSSKDNFIRLYNINPEAYQVNMNEVEKKIEEVKAAIKNNLEGTERYLSFLDDFKNQFMQNPFDFRVNLIGERYTNIAKSYGIADEKDFINVNKLRETNEKKAREEYNQNPDISHQAVWALERLINDSFYYLIYDYSIYEFEDILKQYSSLCEQDPDLFRPFFIVTLYNSGFILYDNDKCEESIPYFVEAVKNLEITCKQDSIKYQEPLAITLEKLNLGITHSLNRSEKKEELEKLLSLTLSKYQVLVERNPEAYVPKLAKIQSELAYRYRELSDYQTSHKYFELALKNYEDLAKQNPEIYLSELVSVKLQLARLYDSEQDNSKSLETRFDAIQNITEMLDKKYSEESSNVYFLVQTYRYIAETYVSINALTDALNVVDLGLLFCEYFHSRGSVTYEEFDILCLKGKILLMQGKDSEALEVYHKVLNLGIRWRNIKESELYKGLKKRMIIPENG